MILSIPCTVSCARDSVVSICICCEFITINCSLWISTFFDRITVEYTCYGRRVCMFNMCMELACFLALEYHMLVNFVMQILDDLVSKYEKSPHGPEKWRKLAGFLKQRFVLAAII